MSVGGRVIGGRVIEVLDLGVVAGKVWVNTKEPSSGDERAIYLVRTASARAISEGDSLWWQGAYAFWTPHFRNGGGSPFHDHRLAPIGLSGVSRPAPLVELAEPDSSYVGSERKIGGVPG